MKILFIEPPPISKRVPERFAGCAYELYHFPDLANLYLLAIAVEEGCDADYLDCVLEKMSFSEMLEEIRIFSPDILVLHSVILSKHIDIQFIKKIKKIFPEIKIVIHGPEPTRVPEEYLIESETYVIRGEPEEVFRNFISKKDDSCMWKNIKGEIIIEERIREKVVDINNLPFPKRKHGRLAKYVYKYFNPKFQKKPHTTMLASRGCSFRCLFCVPNSVSFARELYFLKYFGRKPKPSIMSAKRVIEEFFEIKKEGFNSVMILDDQFLWEKDRTIEICQGIASLNIEWGCLSRADFLTDEKIVSGMKKAGCISIDIGVESFSQRVLNSIRKDIKIETIFTALKLLNKYDISVKLNILFGACPTETKKDIINTIKQIKNLGIHNVMFSIATPFKGTEFYNLCEEKGYLIDKSDFLNPLGKSMISYPKLKNKDLEHFLKKAYRSVYLNPKEIFYRMKSFKNIKDVINNFKILLKILR